MGERKQLEAADPGGRGRTDTRCLSWVEEEGEDNSTSQLVRASELPPFISNKHVFCPPRVSRCHRSSWKIPTNGRNRRQGRLPPTKIDGGGAIRFTVQGKCPLIDWGPWRAAVQQDRSRLVGFKKRRRVVLVGYRKSDVSARTRPPWTPLSMWGTKRPGEPSLGQLPHHPHTHSRQKPKRDLN